MSKSTMCPFARDGSSDRERLAQLALQHFACRVARQLLLADPDPRRHLERCQSVSHVPADVVLAQADTFSQTDDRANFFAVALVGDPDDRRFGDVRMLVEGGLDLGRVDVLAPTD